MNRETKKDKIRGTPEERMSFMVLSQACGRRAMEEKRRMRRGFEESAVVSAQGGC